MLYACSFLHFFDIHFLKEKTARACSKGRFSDIYNELNLATRLAVLSSDKVILPLASYHESTLCREIVDKIKSKNSPWTFSFCANAVDPGAYYESRLLKYKKKSGQHLIYSTALKELQSEDLIYVQRRGSATKTIEQDMNLCLQQGDVPSIFGESAHFLPGDIESRWYKIPSLLDGKAYIVDYIAPILFEHHIISVTQEIMLSQFINRSYFNSYIQALKPAPAMVTDLVCLNTSYLDSLSDKQIPYEYVYKSLLKRGVVRKILNGNVRTLEKFRSSEDWALIFTESMRKKFEKFKDLSLVFSGAAPNFINCNIGEVTMDKYSNIVAAAVGKNASASNVTINISSLSQGEKEQIVKDIDRTIEHIKTTNALSEDIRNLEILKGEVVDDRQPTTIKKLSFEVYDIAKSIGASLFANFIHASMVAAG